MYAETGPVSQHENHLSARHDRAIGIASIVESSVATRNRFGSLPLMLDDARLLAIIVVVYLAAWLHQITIHISVIFVFWFIIQNNGRRSQMANNL